MEISNKQQVIFSLSWPKYCTEHIILKCPILSGNSNIQLNFTNIYLLTYLKEERMKSWSTKIEALPGKILIISHLVPLTFFHNE